MVRGYVGDGCRLSEELIEERREEVALECPKDEAHTMKLLAEGCISSGKAAELLDVTIWRVYELAREQGIALGGDARNHHRSRNASEIEP